MVGLASVLAVIALGACGADDSDDDGGQSEDSAAELSSSLPTADDLGLEERHEAEWDEAADLLERDLVIGGATDPSELGAEIDDAGFQIAVGSDLASEKLNVRLRAIQFDSEEGALEARDLLHDEDLKSPCPDACIVSPIDYKLDAVPDSTAVHHVPNRGAVPPGQLAVEAHHAEFVIGPQLYVVQADGEPSATFSEDFDELMGTVYGSASDAG